MVPSLRGALIGGGDDRSGGAASQEKAWPAEEVRDSRASFACEEEGGGGLEVRFVLGVIEKVATAACSWWICTAISCSVGEHWAGFYSTCY
uniref:Uncharacterized protein MANES_08G137200 n=1 Tax=Rhizophora mucronata TaxID=61149 RepID=A0A2P2K748_RHIMU